VNDDYLDLPEVRSSKELLKRLSVKREKGIEATKDPKVVPNRQFKLSNFKVGCQNTKTVTSSVEEPKQPSQNVKPIGAFEGKSKGQSSNNKTTLQVINELRAGILAISRSLGVVHAKQQEKKVKQQEIKKVAEQENLKSKIESIKVALLEVGNSISKQQPPNEGAPAEVNNNMIKKKEIYKEASSGTW